MQALNFPYVFPRGGKSIGWSGIFRCRQFQPDDEFSGLLWVGGVRLDWLGGESNGWPVFLRCTYSSCPPDAILEGRFYLLVAAEV